MRILIGALVAGAMLLPAIASAQVRVRGYVRSDGTYVAPHVRTAPNNSRSDNWTTSPNYNPYTGQQGTQNPYPVYNPPRVQTYNPYSPPPTPNPYQPRTGCRSAYSTFC